jgi:hypothetical protein
MDETGKEGPHLGPEELSASQMKRSRFPIAVRVADMPDNLGKLLDMGLEEHFRALRG